MMSWKGGPGLAIIVSLGAACAINQIPEPRYGSLGAGDGGSFSFQHNIELFETSNGMRFALVKDDRTNVATVDLRYAVGAAEDPPGRAGLAHLVEHMLFELRGAPDQPTLGDRLGELALYNNAFTSWDFTHYTSTVPIEHLDAVIALEGERMAARCEQFDETIFRRERDVVLAETAREDTDGALWRDVLGEVYGAGHPYARSISNREVADITRDELCGFVSRYYAPNRAYLVVTGPFDTEKLRKLIGRTFGPISWSTDAPRAAIAEPRLDGGESRHTGPVQHPIALVFLPQPAWGTQGTVTYRVARSSLASTLSSDGDRRPWVRSTGVFLAGGQRSPVLVAAVEVDDASRLDDASQLVFESAARMFDGADDRTFRRTVDAMTLSYVAAWDQLPSRGSWLADFMQFTDHNWFMLSELRVIKDLDWRHAVNLLKVRLTPDHAHVAYVTPRPGAATSALTRAAPSATHDLTPWRAEVDPADADRPLPVDLRAVTLDVERYQLANGLTVVLANDPKSPIVDARLVFPGGTAHQGPDRPGLAWAAAYLLEPDLSAEIGRQAGKKLLAALRRGTIFDATVTQTATIFRAEGMAHNALWHVWALSWQLHRGDYASRRLAEVQRLADEEDAPEIDQADLEADRRLYGAGHPYAQPPIDVGVALRKLRRADLVAWKRAHYRPRGATLIVSGAFDRARMRQVIGELFGPWDDVAPEPLPAIPQPRPPAGPTWIADEEPEAVQVGMRIGFASDADPADPLGTRAARLVLERMLDDRLRVVREGMGASYGVGASYDADALGAALFVRGNLDESKAGEATRRILEAIADLRDHAGDARADFVRARRKALGDVLIGVGGASAVAGRLARMAASGAPDDSDQQLAARIAWLAPAEVARVAAADLAADRMVVQLWGRMAEVEAVFTLLGVTPERFPEAPRAPAADAPGDAPGELDGEEPPDAPARDEAAIDDEEPPDGEPYRERLEVASVWDAEGERREGLYLGDREISLDEFLRVSGHTDRIDRMTRRRWLRRGMVGGGALTFAIGAIYGLALADCDQSRFSLYSEFLACQNRRTEQRMTSGAVAVGGLAVAIIGLRLANLRPTDLELRTYAARYNRRRTAAAPPAITDVELAPTVTPDGAGVVMMGRF